jgi:hypothetical protein
MTTDRAVVRLASVTFTVFMAVAMAEAQGPKGFNYDEDKVPPYTLPDPLIASDGSRVKTADEWRTKRRPELLKLFAELEYGKTPSGALPGMTFKAGNVDERALGGKAIRKEVVVHFTGKEDGPSMTILLFTPRSKPKAPCFVGLNFNGNHAVHTDPGITLNPNWMRSAGRNDETVVDHRATEKSRGKEASRWPVEMIIDRGYALATIYYGDIDPDDEGRFDNGIHPTFYKAGQSKPAADEWGAIGAWAWGLSRALDYLETDKSVDAKKVAVNRALAAWKDVAVGGGTGRTVRTRDFKQFRGLRSGAQQADFRRDVETH